MRRCRLVGGADYAGSLRITHVELTPPGRNRMAVPQRMGRVANHLARGSRRTISLMRNASCGAATDPGVALPWRRPLIVPVPG